MTSIANANQAGIVEEVAAVIVANKAFLSEIDGKIGDGDHGINMAKGFGRTAERIAGKDLPLEQTIANMSGLLAGLGMKIEIASWRNLVPNVW